MLLAVELDNLQKRFGSVTALNGVTLQVPVGSIYGLLGVNGAGKSTLLRLLMGFLHASGGSGTLLGRPLGQLTGPERARLAFVSERAGLYDSMTVAGLYAFVRGLQPRWDAAAAQRYLELFRLPAQRRVRDLSFGMRSQLALAVALAGRPDLLLIDEPAAGLDPVHRRRYLQLLLEDSASTERTVLLASHDLALVERACDHVALLHGGRVAVAGPMEEVLGAEKRVRVAAPAAALAALHGVAGVRKVQPEGHGFLVTGRVDPAALRALSGVSLVQAFDLSLEELFWSYVED